MQTCAHGNGVADKLDSVHLGCVIVVCNINRDRKRLKIRHCHSKNESFSDSRDYIRQVFQGKLMSMSTLIKTLQLDQPFHLLIIYK